MELLNSIKYHLTQLDEKTFFAYIGGFLLGIIIIISGLFYYYYSAVDELTGELHDLNLQSQQVHTLFETAAHVKKQEAAVDKVLKEDADFKISSYFTEAVDKLKLNNKVTVQQPSTVEREGKYRETSLHAEFKELDMKQICELLSEIENNQRVYTKSLEIVRAKIPTKLDVTLDIGTLILKAIPGT